jgi:TP901 family phage tail tape measure protein
MSKDRVQTELNGYTAAIGSTTRETGTVIGNGLKTIFSRITTAQPAIQSLEAVGVSIHDLAGNVKPVSEILGELAGKWNTLGKEQQQTTAVNVASRFQLTRFLALMNNWKLATDATTTSINSQGSSMKEQTKFSDSLQARINRLSVAWDKFTLSVGNAVLTNGLIGGLESLNDLSTGFSKVVDKVGVLSGVFGILGVATFSLNTKFKTFATSLIVGTEGLTGAQFAATGLTSAMTRLEIASVALKTAWRGLVASTVVGVAFVALGFAVEKIINAFGEAKGSRGV